MKIAVLSTQEGFNQDDQAKLDQVKVDLQKALDEGMSIAIILPPKTSLDVQQFGDDDLYGDEDEDEDEDDLGDRL